MKKKLNQKGQLLIEILLAILIGSLIIGSAASLIVVSQKSDLISGEKNIAVLLAQEGMEAIESIKGNSWHNIYLPPDGMGDAISDKGDENIYCLKNDGVIWNLSGPFPGAGPFPDCEINVNGKIYTRKIILYNTNREDNDNENITEIAAKEDPSTQKLKIVISHNNGLDIILEEYITRWKNQIFIQSDWAGGPGQLGPISIKDRDFAASPITKYDMDDTNINISEGNLKLKPL